MRYLVTATMAASVFAIGLKMDPAASLPLGGKVTGPDTPLQKVQQEKGGGGMGQGPGAGGGRGGGGGPSAGSPGRGDGGGGAMRGGGGMRDGGGMRGDGGTRFRAERGGRGERGVEFGYRERERGFRGDRDRDRDRHRSGRRDGGFGFYLGPSYGYVPASCEWLRRRALATDSPYWWRRYRACRGF